MPESGFDSVGIHHIYACFKYSREVTKKAFFAPKLLRSKRVILIKSLRFVCLSSSSIFIRLTRLSFYASLPRYRKIATRTKGIDCDYDPYTQWKISYELRSVVSGLPVEWRIVDVYNKWRLHDLNSSCHLNVRIGGAELKSNFVQ